MKIFALSDLHLSFTSNKAMDIFGPQWADHWQKIAAAWQAKVSDSDIVLIAGDISWGMRPPEAEEDLQWLSELPGHKVLTRGNHDYWWQSIGRLRKAYPKLTFIQNDAVLIDNIGICGSRGWPLPGSAEYNEQDQKIFARELQRLQMSLQALSPQAELRIAMLHYPPLFFPAQESDFCKVLEQGRADICVYGHLHGIAKGNYSFAKNGVQYYLTSADYLDFTPLQIFDSEAASKSQTSQA